MRSDRTSRLVAAMSLVVLVVACEIEKVEIPRPDRALALHGVLSASAYSQVVLLERTKGVVERKGPDRIFVEHRLDTLANGRFGRAAVVRFEFEAVESGWIVAGGDHRAADGV